MSEFGKSMCVLYLNVRASYFVSVSLV